MTSQHPTFPLLAPCGNRLGWAARTTCLGVGIFLLFANQPLLADGPDRQVAEWVILMGGSLQLSGETERTTQLADLPGNDYHVELIDLVGTNILPPDLQRLVGLQHLRTLNLPGPMWNPRSGAKTEYSLELRHIAAIATLEKLTFSYSFLESIKFKDVGIEAIATLGPSLKSLSLENTVVRGHRLAPFTMLEELDLASCPIDDDGIKQLQGMSRLRRLLLNDALISDHAMQYLHSLQQIEHLDLSGTRLSDVGIAQLREMTQLRKLSLMGADLTDSGVQSLVGMAKLEELNLYGTKISNVGVDALKELKQLRQLDLRYTRASRAGIEELEAALPECNVLFLDMTVRPALSAGTNRDVADQGDVAVAAWVNELGGRAVLEDGKLLDVSLATTGVTDSLLDNLHQLRDLRRVDLRATEIGDLGLHALAQLSSLEELNLSATMVSDSGLSQIKGLHGLRTLAANNVLIDGTGLRYLAQAPLSELYLSGTPISDQGLAELCKISSIQTLWLPYSDLTDDGLTHLKLLPALRRLDLAGTDVGDAGLAHLGRLTALTELSLSYTRIKDSGMKYLANLNQLQQLGLVRTRVTDKSMAIVGGLEHLREVNLDYTDIGDEGLKMLGPLAQLERLSLDSTNITDASADLIGGFTRLKYLNLYHTLLTQQAYDQIHSALPGCEIVWDPLSSDPKRRRS